MAVEERLSQSCRASVEVVLELRLVLAVTRAVVVVVVAAAVAEQVHQQHFLLRRSASDRVSPLLLLVAGVWHYQLHIHFDFLAAVVVVVQDRWASRGGQQPCRFRLRSGASAGSAASSMMRTWPVVGAVAVAVDMAFQVQASAVATLPFPCRVHILRNNAFVAAVAVAAAAAGRLGPGRQTLVAVGVRAEHYLSGDAPADSDSAGAATVA